MIFALTGAGPMPAAIPLIALMAIILDALVGDPPTLWSRLPHPTVLIGRLIGWAERRLNVEPLPAAAARARGVAAMAGIVMFWTGLAIAVSTLGVRIAGYEILEIIMVAIFLAGRGLYDAVNQVASGLAQSLPAGQHALNGIVGRDTAALDESGVARAAIETLAENFSDGLVAPALWYLAFGLPGLVLYKTINTADSMIGHKTKRYVNFGWCAARLDDFANLIPARLSAGLIALGALIRDAGAFRRAITVMIRDAGKHPSPNAGWPEAAMAGGLGVRLGGPRDYHGRTSDNSWLGAEGSAPQPRDISGAIRIYVTATAGLALMVGGVAAAVWA